MMKIKEHLDRKKSKIIDMWFMRIIETYPPDSHKFFKLNKRQFANPVGYSIHKAIEAILDGIVNNTPLEEMAPHVDEIVKIRAVQNFTPEEATSFTFLLKRVIREVLKKELNEQDLWEEFIDLESEIDDLTLLTFGLYASSRERLFQIRQKEVERRTERLLERLGTKYSPSSEHTGN